MGILDFFKWRKNNESVSFTENRNGYGKSETNKNVEFLIIGEIEIPTENYDLIMTPNSFEWIKNVREDWTYYQVGLDEYSYSWEIPGIQMSFKNGISFEKAKRIADEVVENINATGQEAELVILDENKVYRVE